MSRLLRARVRRLEERTSSVPVVAILEAARARIRRGEPSEPEPQPTREELERDLAAGGVRATLAAARLRLLDMPSRQQQEQAPCPPS